MTKHLKILLMLSLIIAVTALGCVRIQPGYRGVKVNKFGSEKGVETEEVGVGYVWLGITYSVYQFPTFTQNYVWTADSREGSTDDESITMQTKEGLTIGADVGISYKIEPDKVDTVFQKYRRGVDEITDVYLRNMARDALNTICSQKEVEFVYGPGKMEILSAAEDLIREQVAPIGIDLERLYFIGSLRLPGSVVAALNAKIEAVQRAQQRENEIKEKKAEAQKKIAEARGNAESTLIEAEAQAKANKIVAASLTDTLVQYRMIDKWDGAVPRLAGANGGFLISLDGVK